jgi:hypothetical protein
LLLELLPSLELLLLSSPFSSPLSKRPVSDFSSPLTHRAKQFG